MPLHVGSRCKCFAFCGREHQAAFWKLGHKEECAELKESRESGQKSAKDIRALSFAAIEAKASDGEGMPPGAWADISNRSCSCGDSGCCGGAGGIGDPMALYRQVCVYVFILHVCVYAWCSYLAEYQLGIPTCTIFPLSAVFSYQLIALRSSIELTVR